MAALKSSVRAVAVAFVALCLLPGGGCGTDAVGVESCRDIERARCDAAATCGTVDDAASCRRFYHDQCLHGLPVPDPGKYLVQDCVEMIERANACAVAGPDTALADCPREVTSQASVATVCELVGAPELGSECRFLAPDSQPEEPPPPPAAGGAGGAPDESVAGSGGAPDEPAEPSGGSGGVNEEPEPEPVAGGTGGGSDEG
jgi:hypothetical protein